MNFFDTTKTVRELIHIFPESVLPEFYALYKQGTVGDINTEQPYFWNTVERIKWNAWKSKEGMTKEEAQKKYCEYAQECISKYNILRD